MPYPTKDLTDMRFGRLIALEPTEKRHRGSIVWKCQCTCEDKTIVYRSSTKLLEGDINSCGCLKREQDKINLTGQSKGNYEHLRLAFQEQKIDGVAVQLFTDKPNKNNTTGYKGVVKKSDTNYIARIKVNGKTYYKYGFKTAKEAYYQGRLELEKEHLPDEFLKNKKK